MTNALKNQRFDDLLRNIGPDATATFNNSASNPIEHASSAATAMDEGDDKDLEEEDDDTAEEEEDEEDNEEEDVEDEAGV